MTRSNPKAAPAAPSAHTTEAPAVSKTTKRLRTPSVTTSLLAATVMDTPPVVQIPAATVASLTSATPVTASAPAMQPIPTAPGTTPVATSPPTSNGVPAPPDVTMPTPADGFYAEPLRPFMGSYPTTKQLAAMTSAISDLESFVDSGDVLGPLAPATTTVAGALKIGVQWHDMRAPAETWDTYVRTENARAWKAAMMLVDELKPLFLLAVTKNAALASKYPGLTKLFDAPKAAAKHALATKKKKAKAGMTQAIPTAQAAGAASAAPTIAGTPPRTVTVTG